MKLFVLSLLFALTTAQKDICPSTIHVKFYKDKACKTLDDAKTAKEGKPPKEFLKVMDGQCHAKEGASVRITCDESFTYKAYSNAKCSGVPAKKDKVDFGKCTPEGKGSCSSNEAFLLS